MAITDQTWPVAARFSGGTFNHKDLYNGTLAYTEHKKKIAAGTSTAILAATTATVAQLTVTSGITQPDVPRALSVTPGGTTANVLDSKVTVFGTNVEGKAISEDFRFAAAASTVTNGVKAFKSVTSVRIDGQAAGGGVTFSVGTQNIIGLNHRLFRNNTTVKVYTKTSTADLSQLTLQGVPTVVANEQNVENNTVLPATIPNGSLIFIILYYYDNWATGSKYGASLNDAPEYSTTTSTSSTSSSTSTTTITTSTSSTSSSTSSTSTSSTSTSLSTSSTSSSTTTAP